MGQPNPTLTSVRLPKAARRSGPSATVDSCNARLRAVLKGYSGRLLDG